MKHFEEIEKEIDDRISKNELREALELIERKIKESSDEKLISFLLYKKAAIEFFRENQGEAIKNISKSLGVLNDIEDLYFKGEIMFHLAGLFSLMGDFEKGMKLYNKVLKIFPENNYFYLGALNNLGEIHKRKGDIENSLNCFKNAYESSIKNGEFKVSGYTCESLAELYAMKKDKKTAQEYLERALEIAKRVNDERLINFVKLSLAVIKGEESGIKEYSDKLRRKNYSHDVADSFYIFSEVGNEKLREKLLRDAIFLYSEIGDKYMEREAIKKLDEN